ncbi:MAG: aminopeptidase P family protein [Deltaproteobacteria bacterium]|nr:aminopeptidase P family protein [Deltaproteobacteria bacterium]
MIRFRAVGLVLALTGCMSAASARSDSGVKLAADAKDFAARRARLLERLPVGSIALLFGKPSIADNEKQDSDFYYLTGVEDEGAVIVFDKTERRAKLAAGKLGGEILFLKPRDPEAERWTGERESAGESTGQKLGFRFVLRTDSFAETLKDLALVAREIAHIGRIATHEKPVPKEMSIARALVDRIPGLALSNHHTLIRDLRALKTPYEIEQMRRAIAATHAGFKAAFQTARAGLTEDALKNAIESGFRGAGTRDLAFPSIIGSGINSTILHYRGGTRALADGDLVVVDIGAEWKRYAADVTRTIPVSGKFTDEQRKIYDTVLAAQRAAIAKVKPGARIREDIHAAAYAVIAKAGYAQTFIHGTSHFVGLDVHDVGDYRGPLKPGMVITVEPGIYLREKKFGVRIEDMVLVTDDGCEVLSDAIPKDAAAIEAALKKQQ